MTETHYRIEELIPAESAIGGKAYWAALAGGEHWFPWRTDDEEKAFETFAYVQSQDRQVRLVKVTEEILMPTQGSASHPSP